MAVKDEIKISGPTRDLFRAAADRIDLEAKAGRTLRHADVWLLGGGDDDDPPNADLHGLVFLDFGPQP